MLNKIQNIVLGFAGVFYEKLLKKGAQPSVVIRKKLYWKVGDVLDKNGQLQTNATLIFPKKERTITSKLKINVKTTYFYH